MEMNVGIFDRIIRLMVGIALLIWYFGAIGVSPPYPLNYIVLVLAIAMLVTGAAGYCCLYKVAGVNTAEEKKAAAKPAAAAPKKGKKK